LTGAPHTFPPAAFPFLQHFLQRLASKERKRLASKEIERKRLASREKERRGFRI
jgi:hypothetical protein